jgi:hypothetical protein
MVFLECCLEALGHRKLNPASCCIPALLSATAPPSPSIVYHAYGAIMPALHHHQPPPPPPRYPTYSSFPVCLSGGQEYGRESPRAHWTHYMAHLLSKPSLDPIGSHTQALLAPSAIGPSVVSPKSKCSLAKSPVSMLSLHPSEPLSLGQSSSQMCQVSQMSGSLPLSRYAQ